MAQKRRRKSNRRRRRRDTAGIVLRLIVILLILFIAGLILWFIWHDRDLRSGVNALKKERYEDAIACFDSSIEKGKDEAEAYRGKGIALYELEKYEEAASDANVANILLEGGNAVVMLVERIAEGLHGHSAEAGYIN